MTHDMSHDFFVCLFSALNYKFCRHNSCTSFFHHFVGRQMCLCGDTRPVLCGGRLPFWLGICWAGEITQMGLEAVWWFAGPVKGVYSAIHVIQGASVQCSNLNVHPIILIFIPFLLIIMPNFKYSPYQKYLSRFSLHVDELYWAM